MEIACRWSLGLSSERLAYYLNKDTVHSILHHCFCGILLVFFVLHSVSLFSIGLKGVKSCFEICLIIFHIISTFSYFIVVIIILIVFSSLTNSFFTISYLENDISAQMCCLFLVTNSLIVCLHF